MRQAAMRGIFPKMLVIFVVCFAVFALGNTALALIYAPLFPLLMNAPMFTLLALLALIVTLVVRQVCVVEIPSNTVGLIMASGDVLKGLAASGSVWVWFGRERVSGLLSLEPLSVHVPLLGLRSGDDVELGPMVVVITWRVHATITTLLGSEFGAEVREVALESPLRRERRVGDKVAEVMARWVGGETLAELEDDVPGMVSNSFGQGVIEEANQALTSIGLKVERLECLGGLAAATRGAETLRRIRGAREKLEGLLQPGTARGRETLARGDEVIERARRAGQEMRALSRAIDGYVQAVLNVLEQARKQGNVGSDLQAAGAAQKALSERMMALAAEINALPGAARAMQAASEELQDAPLGLTGEELRALLKVLEAVEQKRLPLGPQFP